LKKRIKTLKEQLSIIITTMGIKTKKFKNGELYKGQLKNNKRHGSGTHEWPDQRSYDGQWADDMMNGHGLYTWTKDG
jgi:hypothetical protein